MTTATIAPTSPVRSTPRPVPSEMRAGAGRAGAPSVRLTRRGRLVVVIAVLGLVFAALAVFGSPAVSTGTTHHPASHTVIVQPGQTLWDIADEIAPDRDPRGVIADIVDLNSLADPGAIRAGQPLYVPTQ